MSVGNMAFGLDMDKVLQTDDHSCLLISGSATHGVLLARSLRSFTAIRQNADQRPLPASAKTSFLRDALLRMLPLAAQGMGVMPLFATFDRGYSEEARVYLFTMDGTFKRVECKVLGSGFHAGNAILEDRTGEIVQKGGSITLDKGLWITKRVLRKTSVDDNGSGGQCRIKIISNEGVQIVEGDHGIN